MKLTNNLRIQELTPLITPQQIMSDIPADDAVSELVSQTRQEIADILAGKDQRMVVIVGPCSIHDPKAALDYAARLAKLREQHQDQLCIIMRVYFEKPRTTVGWKGLINDPHLDGSFKINEGLVMARRILQQINQLGLPTGTEFLDTIIPQYTADLISWAAIGARTTESQIHREMTSGLSMPVGFKNGTQGNIDIAVDALFAAKHQHHFLGVTDTGESAIVSTTGNPDCHIILRGGKVTGPNYDSNTVNDTVAALQAKQLNAKVMVDCSHGNSQKDHRKQAHVLDAVCEQRKAHHHIFGVMIESFIEAGNQPLTDQLEYGKSITDACIDWDDTVTLLGQLAAAVKATRGANS